jgi:hypothetical protein
MKVKNTVPLYLRKVIPAGGPYLSFHERSRLDYNTRIFRLEAVNVDFRDMLIIRDIREYRVHPKDQDHTIFIQRCFVNSDKYELTLSPSPTQHGIIIILVCSI